MVISTLVQNSRRKSERLDKKLFVMPPLNDAIPMVPVYTAALLPHGLVILVHKLTGYWEFGVLGIFLEDIQE